MPTDKDYEDQALPPPDGENPLLWAFMQMSLAEWALASNMQIVVRRVAGLVRIQTWPTTNMGHGQELTIEAPTFKEAFDLFTRRVNEIVEKQKAGKPTGLPCDN